MLRGNIVEIGPVEKVLVDPQHPYTKILKESVPEPNPDRKWKGEVELSLLEVKEYARWGCKFAGRCSSVMEICKKEEPANVLLNGRTVSCHLYTERFTR